MSNAWRVVMSVIAVAALWVFNVAWSGYASPQIGADMAVASVNGNGHDFYAANAFQKYNGVARTGGAVLCLIALFAIWKSKISGAIDKATLPSATVPMLLLCAFALCNTGCVRKYDVPEYVEVTPSQTAFVIPLESDPEKQAKFNSESYFETKKVAMKRIQVPPVGIRRAVCPTLVNGWIPFALSLLTVLLLRGNGSRAAM